MTSNWYQTLSGSLDVGNNTKDFARIPSGSYVDVFLQNPVVIQVIELLHESGLVKKVAPATATANVLRCLEVKFRETGYGPTVNQYTSTDLPGTDQPHFSTGASLCAELRECSISYRHTTGSTPCSPRPASRASATTSPSSTDNLSHSRSQNADHLGHHREDRAAYPDFYGDTVAANAGTDSVVWDGNYASMLTVKIQNPVMLRITSNDFENPASCSVYVYFDIDSGVSADEAEALWLSGLLKKIEPSVPDRPAIRVLELKFTANTALTRTFNGGSKTHIDGAAIDSTRKTTQAVPLRCTTSGR
eukprot:tig00021094_g18090.t1